MRYLDCDRKMDTTGRILIPTKVREELNLKEGISYQFYLLEEGNDKYLCIKCPPPDEQEIEKAKNILRRAGYNSSF